MASTFVASEQELVQSAQTVYAALKAQWETYNNYYWQLGHSFDTIIDYFAFIDGSDAANFSQIAQQGYQSSLGSACWYDDFGWWGISALKAAQHPKLFKDVAPFVTIYEGCWKTMYDNAPNVWANNQHNPAAAPFRPRFDGGVWNRGWTGKDECGGTNHLPRDEAECKKDPAQGDNLEGIQNTVTNGLYLVLALRLYEATNNALYLAAAKREYDFLNQWFNVSDSQNGLLFVPGGGVPGALARERMSTYASGTRVCGYTPGLAWSGDQGIIVGGLIDRMIVVPSDNNPGSPASKYAVAILECVASLTNHNSYHGVMQPWIWGNGGDPGDYSTGVGVFMRYLLYADQKNTRIRNQTRNQDYRQLIAANVSAVPTNPTQDAGLVPLTNWLAILVAAIQMSRN